MRRAEQRFVRLPSHSGPPSNNAPAFPALPTSPKPPPKSGSTTQFAASASLFCQAAFTRKCFGDCFSSSERFTSAVLGEVGTNGTQAQGRLFHAHDMRRRITHTERRVSSAMIGSTHRFTLDASYSRGVVRVAARWSLNASQWDS
jgi:hypothetical protein